jgi:hypothetical protein
MKTLFISKWWNRPARWWQFWFPESGAIGGVIFGVIFLSILILISSILLAKEVDFSVVGNVGYGHAKWGSGMYPQPGGSMERSAPIYNPSFQIKYTRWIIQPTFEFNYRWAMFDFGTHQAPVQKMDPRAWSILGGLTYDFTLFSFYGLMGVTCYNARVSLIEANPALVHGRQINFKSDLFSYKIGAYKLYKIGPIKVGPELSLQGWSQKPGWSRCREGRENIIQPNLGLKIQW